jgi:hypothetical protein
MKKFLTITLLAASLVACKSKDNDISTDKDIIILGDSSKLIPGNTLTDTALLITTNADGTTSAEAVIPGEKKVVPVAPVVRKTTPTKSSSTASSSSSGSGTRSAGTSSGTTSNTTQKTGISKAAKGAIIGGVGGAAAGAVIGRNAKGAVIGGAVGAAGGYIIGRKKDRNDGRVQ